ncbi:MAG: translation elongation factor-like protein [Candidatus Pacebacteria bacterium]|jgi:putative protease|nr:translation elongation factor-like protein [Candidatus Paceibacterota bacterium]MDP7159263.1 translation elongation factor-like protein [Candidatus Paceibacterota bacterium]MDP7466069.1 translation elongation factor-like protein [Candidatus Paceibacterota bacterium]MDP7648234.1 translation elongation factor-like protein [Candidatus Paceibacterota bacterium]HJO89718.1 translation elongation factor-like protein [Candidatus Paceibacterota bacterium]|tara:strand:+ start:88 stop:345 length:258 start_codon:yes stop_codon:yes gene_type:complete
MSDTKEKLIGKVTHYYSKIGVAIIELSDSISVGDVLHFKDGTTDFEEKLSSIEVEHENVSSAKKGAVVGVKVSQKVRGSEQVYKK